MAEREIVINSALCFVINSRRKHPQNVIKSILSDFYSLEIISNAKEVLIADINKAMISVNKMPPSRRNNTVNKLKMDIEDILNLFESIDQSGDMDKLPRYATDNLDHIPVFKMDAGGLSVLLSKLDKLDEKLDKAYCASRSAPISNIHPLPSVSDYGPDMEWGDTGDSVSADPFDGQVRRKRKRTVHSKEPSEVTIQATSNLRTKDGQGTSTLNYSKAVKQNTNMIKSTRIIGRSNIVNPANGLRSAKPYVKKKIFGVYNVDPAESVDSVSSFVVNICGAPPISCFAVGKGSTDTDQPDQPLAFRICIDAQYCTQFLDPDIWPNGISIRDWKFKPRPAVVSNNGNTNKHGDTSDTHPSTSA